MIEQLWSELFIGPCYWKRFIIDLRVYVLFILWVCCWEWFSVSIEPISMFSGNITTELFLFLVLFDIIVVEIILCFLLHLLSHSFEVHFIFILYSKSGMLPYRCVILFRFHSNDIKARILFVINIFLI